jgi:DNA-directed RNA polymerase specialized sigma24 family protein
VGLVRNDQSGNDQGLSVHDCPQPFSAGTQKRVAQVALDEMPYEEIARALRISLPAVKVKVHRARLALADIRNP